MAFPRPVGSASHGRAIAHGGASTSRCEVAKRSGKIWYATDSTCQAGAGAPVDDGEVVGVRHLVLGQAECVHPGVADVAAGQQEPVAGDRVPHRERRPPPHVGVRLLVDDRLDAAWLAVALVAAEDAVGASRARHAQPHDRFVAELLGPLHEVQLGAVVVRLVEQ